MIPESGRSPGEGNGNPLQHSCLENPMNGGAWRATVHGVARVGHDLVTKSLPRSKRQWIYIYTCSTVYLLLFNKQRLTQLF